MLFGCTVVWLVFMCILVKTLATDIYADFIMLDVRGIFETNIHVIMLLFLMSSKRKEKEEKNTRENYGILADCGVQTCLEG